MRSLRWCLPLFALLFIFSGCIGSFTTIIGDANRNSTSTTHGFDTAFSRTLVGDDGDSPEYYKDEDSEYIRYPDARNAHEQEQELLRLRREAEILRLRREIELERVEADEPERLGGGDAPAFHPVDGSTSVAIDESNYE